MTRAGTTDSFFLLVGTLFGAGYLPKAPGTWGSLLFLPFIVAAYQLGGTAGILILTAFASVLSIVTAPAAIRKLGDDPGEFVMDECAGQGLVFAVALPLLQAPLSITILLGGFLLFRLFDITKPLGVKRVEKFPGKYGILMDDLLAGLYASLSLIAVIYLISLI